jgi:hypothetical protein
MMPTTERRPMLYIAGPYTHPDPVVNTHKAAKVGTLIYEHTQWVPFVPHLSLLWHIVTPRPESHWYALDLAQMAHCDAIVRLPGASSGADHEMAEAMRLGLTVVDFDDLPSDCREAWL